MDLWCKHVQDHAGPQKLYIAIFRISFDNGLRAGARRRGSGKSFIILFCTLFRYYFIFSKVSAVNLKYSYTHALREKSCMREQSRRKRGGGSVKLSSAIRDQVSDLHNLFSSREASNCHISFLLLFSSLPKRWGSTKLQRAKKPEEQHNNIPTGTLLLNSTSFICVWACFSLTAGGLNSNGLNALCTSGCKKKIGVTKCIKEMALAAPVN